METWSDGVRVGKCKASEQFDDERQFSKTPNNTTQHHTHHACVLSCHIYLTNFYANK